MKYVPVCMQDYDFLQPPLYYRFTGVGSADVLAAWCVVIIFLLLAVPVATPVIGISPSPSSVHHSYHIYDGEYHAPSTRSSDDMAGWVVLAYMLVLGIVLLISCSFGFCWSGRATKDDEKKRDLQYP